MAHLTVSLVTPEKDIVKGDVDQVTAPSVMGEVGILPDHLPLLADMSEGAVGLFRGGQVELYAVSGGFVEVDHNHVTILAETAEHGRNIDIKRSENAFKSAQGKLRTLDFQSPEYAEQEARVRRAQVRLDVARASQAH
ncbi:MAG: ATP synthase F1 subunit epsilon [Myxococcota bacterium]